MEIRTYSKLLILILLSAFALSGNSVSEKSKLDLKTFDGNWEGEGTYYLPFTGIPTSVDATAKFEYDKIKKNLRTALTAERFMLQYSDSGLLVYSPKKDSLNWEIWNSFGYHVQYAAGVKGKTIQGRRQWGKDIYNLQVDLITDDSMKIKITITDDKGDSTEIADGYLRRVKVKSD